MKHAFMSLDNDDDSLVSANDLSRLGREVTPPKYIGQFIFSQYFLEQLVAEYGRRCDPFECRFPA